MESLKDNTTELKKIYDDFLEPKIKKIDKIYIKLLKEKQRKIHRCNHFSILTALVFGIPAIAFNSRNGNITFGFAFVGITAVGALQYVKSILIKERKKLMTKIQWHYKKNVFGTYCNLQYKDFVHIPRQRMGKNTIQNSMLFERGLYIRGGEDFFRFWIDDVMIQFSEICISFSKNKDVTPIRNFLISVEFNKPFTQRTVILQKDKLNNNTLTAYLTGYQEIVNKMEKIKLEESEFTKCFDVYSDSQIESRYILSPSFMSMLTSYKKEKNWDISVSFNNNHMYMRFDGGHNFFEPKIKNDTFCNFDYLKEDLQLIENINQIVQLLHLNQKIWKV